MCSIHYKKTRRSSLTRLAASAALTMTLLTSMSGTGSAVALGFQSAPPPPGVPAGASAPVATASTLLNGLKGVWLTNFGATLTIEEAITTAGAPTTLHARARKSGQSLEDFYLRSEGGIVQGFYTATPGANVASDWSSFGIITIASLSADGKSFTGKVVLKNGNTFPYTGSRIPQNGGSTVPAPNSGHGTTGPSTGSTDGTGNTGIVPPVSRMGLPGDGKFYSLDLFELKVDEIRMGRGNNLEMIVTYKATTDNVGVQPGTCAMTITDASGLGTLYNGNLYRASGERLDLVDGTIWLSRNETARVRYVFVLPEGTTGLKKLTAQEHGTEPRHFDLSQVKLIIP